jgi:hypothetical protein
MPPRPYFQVTADSRPLPKIPANENLPVIQASPLFEETRSADSRQIGYADWFRRPRWERAAMVARDRLQRRLDYWLPKWHQGEYLPPPQVLPG